MCVTNSTCNNADQYSEFMCVTNSALNNEVAMNYTCFLQQIG